MSTGKDTGFGYRYVLVHEQCTICCSYVRCEKDAILLVSKS